MIYTPSDPSTMNIPNIAWNYSEGHAPNSELERSVLIREFNEWLAEYTRQQREEAWDKAVRSIWYDEIVGVTDWPDNPHREESQ